MRTLMAAHHAHRQHPMRADQPSDGYGIGRRGRGGLVTVKQHRRRLLRCQAPAGARRCGAALQERADPGSRATCRAWVRAFSDTSQVSHPPRTEPRPKTGENPDAHRGLWCGVLAPVAEIAGTDRRLDVQRTTDIPCSRPRTSTGDRPGKNLARHVAELRSSCCLEPGHDGRAGEVGKGRRGRQSKILRDPWTG